MLKPLNLKKLIVMGALALIIPLTACSGEPQPPTSKDKYQGFSLKFDAQGKLTVIDGNGRPLEPVKLDFPIKNEAIENITSTTITSVQVRGSHYCIIKIGDKLYKFMLSHGGGTQSCPL